MTEGKQVASLYAKIGADLSDLNKGLSDMGSKMRSAGQSMSSLGTKLTLAITLPAIGAAAAMTKMAMDAVESESLFTVSMGEMAGAAREFSEDLRDQFGLNSYEIRRQVGTWNVMLDAMGMGKQAAFEMSKGLTMLANDMASFYNMSPDEAFQKLQAGITGEIEPLKRLGIVINETTVKEYALAQGLIKSGEELSESQKIMARYALIMKQTATAQGDLARTIESPANQLRIFRSQLEETAIEAGQVFLPVLSGALNWINETGLPVAREKLNELKTSWTEMSDEARAKVIVTASLFLASGPLLKGLSWGIRGVGLLASAFNLLPGVAKKSVALALGGLLIFHDQIASIADGIAGLFDGLARGMEFLRGFGYEAKGLRGVADSLRSFGSSLRSPKDAMIALGNVATGIVMPAFDGLIGQLAEGATDIAGGIFGDGEKSIGNSAKKQVQGIHDAGSAAKFVADQFKLLPPSIDEGKAASKAAAQAAKDYSNAVKLLRGQMTALKDATEKYGASSEEAQSIQSEIAAGLDELKANYSSLSAVQQQEVDNMASAFDKLVNKPKELAMSMQVLTAALISQHPATISAAQAVREWESQIDAVNLALVANRDQMQAAQRDLQGMQDRLGDLNRRLGEAKSRFSELMNPRLAGMGKFDAQIVTIQDAIRKLEIEKVQLQISGGDTKGVDSQLEGLRNQLRLVELTKEDTFAGPLRQLKQAAEGAKKEMTFAEALQSILSTKSEIGNLTDAIAGQEGAIRNQQNAIQAMQDAADAMNRTLAEFQIQLQQAKANQDLVTRSLQMAYTWFLEDREKIVEMGGAAEDVAKTMDEKTKELLQAVTLAATDSTGKSQATLATMVEAYQRDMAIAMLEVGSLKGALESIPTDIKTRHTTIHSDIYTGATGGEGLPYAGEYAKGGIVPGPVGAPALAVVHGGEPIGAGFTGGGNTYITVNVAGSVAAERDLAQSIRRELLLVKNRNVSTGL